MAAVESPEPGQLPNQGAVFLREADSVLRDLRPALAGILDQLRPPVMRPSELGRRLELDKKLSWSVFNAATARDARALVSLLPGRRAMERFFAAAAAQGVGGERIGAARAAFERFEESVAKHAGSRDTFETMLSGPGPGGGTPGAGESGLTADLRHKRAAFRANSLLWGRQARVCTATMILHPSARPGLLDQALIRGMVGLRRTRRGVPLHTTAHRWRVPAPGDPAAPERPMPLDPREAGPDAMGLLRDFCSQPPPEFRLCESREGYRNHELVSNALGPSSQVTYFWGEATRSEWAVPGSVPGAEVTLTKSVDVPCEAYSGDLIVHKSVLGPEPPVVRVYAVRLDGSKELRDADLLPLAERAGYLGDGIDAARTPLIPRYSEMLSYAMERMGWRAEEFRVFRCRVDFPVMYSRIRMTLR